MRTRRFLPLPGVIVCARVAACELIASVEQELRRLVWSVHGWPGHHDNYSFQVDYRRVAAHGGPADRNRRESGIAITRMRTVGRGADQPLPDSTVVSIAQV